MTSIAISQMDPRQPGESVENIRSVHGKLNNMPGHMNEIKLPDDTFFDNCRLWPLSLTDNETP